MARLEPLERAATDGRARELLDELASRGGEPGPMVRAMAIDIRMARQGTASDPKIAALVAFGQQVFVAPAETTDEQIDELRELGYTDEQIAEVVGLVALNVLTGAFNLVAGIHATTTARSAA